MSILWALAESGTIGPYLRAMGLVVNFGIIAILLFLDISAKKSHRWAFILE
jgi:hypothetical protein